MSQVGYIIAPPLTINYHGWWVGKILSWLRWLFGETVVRGNDAGKDDGGGGLLSCVLNPVSVSEGTDFGQKKNLNQRVYRFMV